MEYITNRPLGILFCSKIDWPPTNQFNWEDDDWGTLLMDKPLVLHYRKIQRRFQHLEMRCAIQLVLAQAMGAHWYSVIWSHCIAFPHSPLPKASFCLKIIKGSTYPVLIALPLQEPNLSQSHLNSSLNCIMFDQSLPQSWWPGWFFDDASTNRTLPHFLEDKLKESRTSLRRKWTNLPRNPFQHRWPRLDAGRERSLRLPGLSWLHVSGRCRDPQTAKKHQCIYGCCKSAAATESKFHPLPANNTCAKPWLEKAGCYQYAIVSRCSI